jgi:hypothetical protein
MALFFSITNVKRWLRWQSFAGSDGSRPHWLIEQSW